MRKRALAFLFVLAAVGGILLSNRPSEATRLLTLNRIEGPFETTMVTTNTASVGTFGPKNLLYGFDVITTSSAGVAALYDVATLGAATLTQGNFIDEGGTASSGDVFKSEWPAPYELQTDLTVLVSSANCVIYHDRK